MISTKHSEVDIWCAFTRIINEAVELFVPFKLVINKSNCRSRGCVYPNYIKRELARKLVSAVCGESHRESPQKDVIYSAYREAESRCRLLIQKFEIKNEKRIIDSNSSGSFYKYVNNKIANGCSVGTLIDSVGKPVFDDTEKADLLNSYFCSMGTDDNGVAPVLELTAPNGVNITNVSFTPDSVKRAIKKMKGGRSSGPDDLSSIIFNQLSDSLALPLSLLFESFVSTSSVPNEWRAAHVVPVFKSGSSAQVANYSPISLTCIACKLMERLINVNLLGYLHQHKLISKAQHGFLSRRSTTTNLLETLTIGLSLSVTVE